MLPDNEGIAVLFPPARSYLFAEKGAAFSRHKRRKPYLYSKAGFWYDLYRKKMPKAKFLMLEERLTYNELVNASALPSFYTKQAEAMHEPIHNVNRVNVPILDKEATVTYYLAYRAENLPSRYLLFAIVPP